MIQKRKNKHRSTRTVLRLPDLDHSKSSVLQSLGSAAWKRTYGAAIEDFITWYCSEPRLAFGRTVVLHCACPPSQRTTMAERDDAVR